ncbi:MAG: type II secretion system secretin GspD [Alphaproteobacteria bacterium]
MRATLAAGLILLLASLFWSAPPAHADDGHMLNYRDADIRAFIDDISMLTSSTFIVDPRVKGKVTVISNAPVDTGDLFDLFLATLRVNGYSIATMPSGAYKILPNEAAVQDAGAPGSDAEGDRFVTEVFRLDYVDSVQALKMLKAIVHPDGRTEANRQTNSVVVIDYASNMDRVREVIESVDQDTSIYKSVPLNNTAATEMVRIVSALKDGDDGQSQKGLSAVAIEASNTVVLKGNERAVTRMAAFIAELDGNNRGRKRVVRVMPLSHAEAEDLVPLLQDISNSIAKSADDEGAPPVQMGDTHIAAHNGTNAIVIHAGADMMNKLIDVVNRLDVPRRQVLVEALIVEISDQAAKELGVQYILTGNGDSAIPFSATTFSTAAPDLLAATGALVAPGLLQGGTTVDTQNGTSITTNNQVLTDLQQAAVSSLLGLSGFVGGAAGQTSSGTIFGVIINAIQRDVNSNILATPSITTMDNADATLLVGQEVPIATGEALGQNFENTFRTVTREDVGIQLEVRPQITTGNAIKLFVRQEASSIFGPVSSSSSDLILNKRELSTTVVVEDGGLAVLGGLIEDDEQISVEKVPLLGDIPGLGKLFRSKQRSNVRTNLMVFLRPRIVRNAADLSSVSGRKYDYIRNQEMRQRREGEGSRLDQLMRDVMNAEPPAP